MLRADAGKLGKNERFTIVSVTDIFQLQLLIFYHWLNFQLLRLILSRPSIQ